MTKAVWYLADLVDRPAAKRALVEALDPDLGALLSLLEATPGALSELAEADAVDVIDFCPDLGLLERLRQVGDPRPAITTALDDRRSALQRLVEDPSPQERALGVIDAALVGLETEPADIAAALDVLLVDPMFTVELCLWDLARSGHPAADLVRDRLLAGRHLPASVLAEAARSGPEGLAWVVGLGLSTAEIDMLLTAWQGPITIELIDALLGCGYDGMWLGVVVDDLAVAERCWDSGSPELRYAAVRAGLIDPERSSEVAVTHDAPRWVLSAAPSRDHLVAMLARLGEVADDRSAVGEVPPDLLLQFGPLDDDSTAGLVARMTVESINAWLLGLYGAVTEGATARLALWMPADVLGGVLGLLKHPLWRTTTSARFVRAVGKDRPGVLQDERLMDPANGPLAAEVARLFDELGDNTAAWEVVAGLAPSWDRSIGELVAVGLEARR